MTSQVADDRGQLVLCFRIRIDRSPQDPNLLPHPSHLHLLDDHHQKESNDDDDEQKCPDPEAKPSWSIVLDHGDRSISPQE